MQFEKAEFDRARPEAAAQSGGGFGRAALYGLGAAVGGSALFALVSLTGFQFSIIAILVGVMVGKAIRYAVQGRGGLRYQALAVALTYGAITTSYLPGMLWEISKKHEVKATAAKAEKPAPRARGPLGFALGIALLAAASLTFPFLFLAGNFFSGVINLVIIGIGLRQAWRITAACEAH